MKKLHATLATVSFVLLLKSFAGGAVAALALFGVTLPQFGIEPGLLGEGVVATAGGLVGTALAIWG